MIIAKRAAGILDCYLEGLASLPLAVDLQIEVASINALKGRQRNVNVLVDQVAEDGTTPLFHADNAHRQTGHLELFADRVDVRVELVLDISAKDDYQLAVRHFFRLDEASVRHRLVFDLSHVGGYPEDNAAEEGHAVLLEFRSMCRFRPYGSAGFAIFLQPLHVRPFQLLITTVHAL